MKYNEVLSQIEAHIITKMLIFSYDLVWDSDPNYDCFQKYNTGQDV